MHLRLGKSIVSGLSKPSKVSTQGSGIGHNPRLSPIVEDIYLGETESTTSTSISMASYSEGMSEDGWCTIESDPGIPTSSVAQSKANPRCA